MAKTMSFSEYYDILFKKTEEIRKELEDAIIPESEDIPEFEEIKNTDIRYEYYSKAVKTAISLSRVLSNTYFTKDAVVRVKQKLQKDTTTPSKMVTLWIRDTDNLIQTLDNLLQSAKYYKEGIDNLLKFYQSACYMFGGIFEVKSSI